MCNGRVTVVGRGEVGVAGKPVEVIFNEERSFTVSVLKNRRRMGENTPRLKK